MPQTDYNEMASAFAGMIADSGFTDIVSQNLSANVKQVATISLTTAIAAVAQVGTFVITTAANGDAFNIYINGVLVATGTTSGNDKAVQSAAIKVLLDANAYFAANFTCVDDEVDTLTITAINPGEGFSLENDVESTSVHTWTVTTPNTVGTYIHLTLDGHDVYFPCDSTTEEDERDSFQAVLEADSYVTDLVDIAASGSGPYNIVLTAKTAGVPFTAALANENQLGAAGSGAVAIAATTANVTSDPTPFGRGVAHVSEDKVSLPSADSFTFEGVAVHKHKSKLNATALAQYEAGEAVSVLRRGRVWVPVDQTVAAGDTPHLRYTANGPTSLPGMWRKDVDTNKADAVPGCRFIIGAAANGLALLEVNNPVV